MLPVLSVPMEWLCDNIFLLGVWLGWSGYCLKVFHLARLSLFLFLYLGKYIYIANIYIYIIYLYINIQNKYIYININI